MLFSLFYLGSFPAAVQFAQSPRPGLRKGAAWLRRAFCGAEYRGRIHSLAILTKLIQSLHKADTFFQRNKRKYCEYVSLRASIKAQKAKFL